MNRDELKEKIEQAVTIFKASNYSVGVLEDLIIVLFDEQRNNEHKAVVLLESIRNIITELKKGH